MFYDNKFKPFRFCDNCGRISKLKNKDVKMCPICKENYYESFKEYHNIKENYEIHPC